MALVTDSLRPASLCPALTKAPGWGTPVPSGLTAVENPQQPSRRPAVKAPQAEGKPWLAPELNRVLRLMRPATHRLSCQLGGSPRRSCTTPEERTEGEPRPLWVNQRH